MHITYPEVLLTFNRHRWNVFHQSVFILFPIAAAPNICINFLFKNLINFKPIYYSDEKVKIVIHVSTINLLYTSSEVRVKYIVILFYKFTKLQFKILSNHNKKKKRSLMRMSLVPERGREKRPNVCGLL